MRFGKSGNDSLRRKGKEKEKGKGGSRMTKRSTIWSVVLILCCLFLGTSALAAEAPTISGIYENGAVMISGKGFPANTEYPMIAIIRSDNPPNPDNKPIAIGFASTDADGKLSLKMVTDSSFTDPTGYCVCVYNNEGKAVAQGPITVADQENKAFTIQFDPTGGSCDTVTLITDENGQLSMLPSATRTDFIFQGWYLADGITKVTLTTVFTADTTIIAHWVFYNTPSSPNDSSHHNNSNHSEPVITIHKDITVPVPTRNNEDGSATVTLSATDANQITADAVEHHSRNVTIQVNDPTNLTYISMSMPQSLVQDLFDKTSASLIIVTPLATMTFTREAVGNLASKVLHTIGVDIKKIGNTFQIVFQADGKIIDVLENVTVTFPVDKNAGMGTVAIVVNPNGSETIIKNCIPVDGMMSLSLNGNVTVRIKDNGKSFLDTTEHWATEAIQFVTGRELFHGVSQTSFEPNSPMTRAMLVTVLYRLEDRPDSGTSAFSDITDGLWYSEAVAWASENKIVNGNPDGAFRPNGPITREQLATILFRYATSIGMETNTTSSLHTFTDRDQVSPYATEAIAWAVDKNIIHGRRQDSLDPKGNATRAEVATMLMRFIQIM